MVVHSLKRMLLTLSEKNEVYTLRKRKWFTLSEKNVLQNFLITVNVVLNVYNVVLHATNIMWLQTIIKECGSTFLENK